MENQDLFDNEIIGLDSNVLVDLVNSIEFRNDLKAEIMFDKSILYTTEVALSEARNVLIKKKNYSKEDATKRLLEILREFNIEKVEHVESSNKIAREWFDKVRKEMIIGKFSTFYNDCKILANLYNQKKINVYYTEDKDIKKAVEVIGIKLKVRIISEATNLSDKKVSKFFKEKHSSFHR